MLKIQKSKSTKPNKQTGKIVELTLHLKIEKAKKYMKTYPTLFII